MSSKFSKLKQPIIIHHFFLFFLKRNDQQLTNTRPAFHSNLFVPFHSTKRISIAIGATVQAVVLRGKKIPMEHVPLNRLFLVAFHFIPYQT